MNSLNRISRTRHVIGELAQAPMKGSQVRDARDVLEKVTADLTAKRIVHERAREVVRESSARVRDATVVARAECKKGRAALVAKGIEIAPHATDRGASPRNVLARADFLVEHGSMTGVKLPELVAARDELSAALVVHADVRKERLAASEQHALADQAWDEAYAGLRAAIEAELRKEHVRGAELKRRLAAYFPKQVRVQPAAEATSPAPPASEKPAA